MNQKDDEPPPFWLQTRTTLDQVDRHRGRTRQTSSLFLNTGFLLIFLLLTAFLFLVIIIPYILSVARQIVNPNFVKTSWTSLNIGLVLFAILCGFLSRNNDDQTNTPSHKNVEKSKDRNVSQWPAYHGRVENVGSLRRSSNSYPDLRQDSGFSVDGDKFRFYDENDPFQRSDSELFLKRGENENESEVVSEDEADRVQVRSSDNVSPSPSVIDEDEIVPNSDGEGIVQGGSESESESDDNFVDEDELITKNEDDNVDQQPPQTVVPPPLPPRSIPKNQTFETIGYGRYNWNTSPVVEEVSESQHPPASPPPPQSPPSSPPHRSQYSACKHEKSGGKRGGVTVTKEFFTSFYHQSKRKRKHTRRSSDNLEEFIEPSQTTSIHRSKSTPEFPPPSPPPPPPPPPHVPSHSVFHTLFSTKGKTKKKVHSISNNSIPNSNKTKFATSNYVQRHEIGGYSAFGDESKTLFSPLPPSLPKKPGKKPDNYTRENSDEKGAFQGNDSPLRPIPTPPPPPPFQMKPWRFAIQGDYAKIESNNNSPRSGYSASEDESISPSSAKNSQTPSSPVFCPSPDVNMKADDFIAKFRAKLTLEKSDSINLKQGTGHSRLRPDSS